MQGGRNTVIDTQANAKLSENISFVFGSKFLQTLIPLDMEMALPMLTGSSVTAEDDEDGIADSVGVRICGFISKAGVGVGRSDNDRQFVFCNGRPVDLPKITRMMNEVKELKTSN